MMQTVPCNEKEKFACSSLDAFGFMEYCVETYHPYEFVKCKNRTMARKIVRNFKRQGRMSVVIGVTAKGNDYIIRL